MGVCRFLYNNLITGSSMIAVSSLRAGFVTSAYKEGAGSAIMNTFGPFTGMTDIEYVVKIMSTAGASGNEVGVAKYQWRDVPGTTWNQSSVLTSSSSTDSTLGNGVTVSFASAAGNDFELNDAWYFKGINLFNPAKSIDLDRNSRMRSSAAVSTWAITIDLGSAKEVKGIVLYDHNLGATAVITIQGDSSSGFSGGYTTTVTYNANKIIHYLVTASTYRYWQIRINDAVNADGYYEFSEIFLGSYFEPSGNFEANPELPIELIANRNYMQSGVRRNLYYNQKRKFNLNFPYMQPTDNTSFQTILDTIGNQDTKELKPIFFHVDSTNADDFFLCYLDSMPRSWFKGTKWNIRIDLEEALKKKL